MNRLRATQILLLAFIGIFSSPANAQFNLKTGYNISFLSQPGLNQIIDAFNGSHTYSSPFRNLTWLHGFEGGLRVKGGMHALELTYQGNNQSFRASGEAAGTQEKYIEHLRYSIQAGSIGYQLCDRSIGMGADLQYQFYRTTYINQVKETFKTSQHLMAVKLYLMATVKGHQGVDLAIQPYLVLPTQPYDYSPLVEMLKTEVPIQKEKWIRYGITILFYNGEK